MQKIYLITSDHWLDHPEGLTRMRRLIGGEIHWFQYRRKEGSTKKRWQEASQLQACCKEFGVTFIVNDDVALAQSLQADGVHLGQDDLSVSAARDLLGPAMIIGQTCHNNPELALRAASQGASYFAFGPCFPSKTKPGKAPISLAVFKKTQALFAEKTKDYDWVAIGGITKENAPLLLQSGATTLAICDGLLS